MINEINYEEDLFLLKGLIKFWSEGIQIPGDPDFFSEKLMDDLDFIEAILTKLWKSIQSNGNFIFRGEMLHDLVNTKTTFAILLSSILQADTTIKKSLESMYLQLRAMKENQYSEVETIRKQIKSLLGEEDLEEDLITPMEMEFLLHKEEDL